MKEKIFSSLLIVSIVISSVIINFPQQVVVENNDVANLALMLPESDVIVAIDMNKTLNVAGPSLLNQDQKKIENLKKLMRSLENVIGINPYEIKQIVAGVKLPSVEEKDFFNKMDFTVIFRTAHSNNALLEDWSKKIDAIEAFNDEKDPSERYIDAFKAFRYYKITEDENEEITKLNKEFEDFIKKIGEVNMLLTKLPASARSNKTFIDLLKKNKNTVDSVVRLQTVLKKDFDVKNLRDASIKLQNRWYEVSMDDPKRVEKLATILKEAKEIFPNYKTKTENLVKTDALIHISNYEFYDKLTKKNFGLPDINDDFEKDPIDMMKEKLAEVTKTLNNFPTSKTKQNSQLKSISKSLQKIENGMNIWLKEADGGEKLDYLIPDETTQTKSNHSFSKSIKENAKISEVNGKRLITIDSEKVDFWNSGIERVENVHPTDDKSKTEVTIETSQIKTEVVKKDDHLKEKKDETKNEEKKKELFAIGYLDETTMVLGFESGIRTILSRKGDYKNPQAAEMLSSFKNPLVSFATNSKIFQNFMKPFETPPVKKDDKDKEDKENKDEKNEKVEKDEKDEKAKKEKKLTSTDKFFNNINIFGSIEYDGDSATANDIIMSLGFTKNKVEEVFSIEDDEESSVFEVGDYQISKAIFYDLLNTLKVFKASVSFKFEKNKVAALIESAPQTIEDIRFQQKIRKDKVEKTKIQSFRNIEDLLTSPKFYTDFIRIFTNN